MGIKTIVIFTILSMANAFAATSYSQAARVSLDIQNSSLEQVMDDIEQQSEFYFIFNQKQIDVDRVVSIRAENKLIADILPDLFKGTNVNYAIFDRKILLTTDPIDNNIPSVMPAGKLQQRKITGTITDAVTGEPLPGVNILVEGTLQGVITDINGEYSILVNDASAILVFSYIGYLTEKIAVEGNSVINLALSTDIQQLDEVVVVGYTSQKKTSLTGSVAKIDEEKLENRPVTNSIDVLQGTAPGLIVTRTSGQPGNEGWSMNIRGFSSLNGTNQPLVIIDGVEGDLNQLNPNDIETVSVLKDAAATAIYGAKSSGGVVIVTTKKSSGKLKIDYTGLYTIRVPHGIPDRVHTYEWAEMQNVANSNAGINPAWTEEQIGWFRKDTVILNSSDLSSIGYYYDIDTREQLLRSSTPSQSHNVSIAGGNERVKFLFSAGFLEQSGLFKFGPDKNERSNLRLNLSTKLTDFLSLDSRIAYTKSDIEAPEKNVTGRWGLMHTILALGLKGTMGAQPAYLPGYEGVYYLDAGTDHPYAYLKSGGYKNTKGHNVTGTFTLKADILKGLSARLVYSPSLSPTSINTFKKSIPCYSFTTEGVPVLSRTLNNPNSITKQRYTQISQELQGLIDYDLVLANDHNFHVLFGYQFQDYYYDYTSAQVKNLLSNDFASLNFGSDPTVSPTVSDDIEKNAWSSFLGRINYNYKEKYYFEGVLRNDASSRLAPGYRHQTFPALSIAWRISQEEWFRTLVPFVNELKIRGSWGKLGNAQLGSNNSNNYNYIAQLASGDALAFNGDRNSSIYQAALASPNLGWETVETSDVGMDLSLFNSHYNASFDYFIRKNNDMLIKLNQPAVLGVSPSTVNGAAMKTWGWELSMGWRERMGEFNYSIDLNVDDNKNEITRYEGNVVYSSGTNTAIPGYSINSIFGYRDQGYFQSADEVSNHAFQTSNTGVGDIKYLDVDNSGQINAGEGTKENHGDLVYLGNLSPRYNFGITFSFEWKGIDFSAFFNGTGKRNILIESNIRVPYVVGYNAPWAIHEDYWTEDNTDAKFPRLYTGSNHNTVNSSFWVQNGAYIRLKNLQIGYTLPQKITEKVKLQKARVFFTGQDIWEVNKMWFNVFDAEYPNNAGYTYPFFRSYAMGLNLTF